MSGLIVFLQCGKQKLPSGKHKASEIYTSNLFRTSLAYARKLTSDDNIRILSGKFGALRLSDIIEPYNVTLKTMTGRERERWGDYVKGQLRAQGITSDRPAIFLTGEVYQRPIADYFQHCENPLKGLGLGYRIQFMKRKLRE